MELDAGDGPWTGNRRCFKFLLLSGFTVSCTLYNCVECKWSTRSGSSYFTLTRSDDVPTCTSLLKELGTSLLWGRELPHFAGPNLPRSIFTPPSPACLVLFFMIWREELS